MKHVHQNLLRSALYLMLPLLLAADTSQTVREMVEQGLQHFRSREFSEAETAFSEAAELAPENPAIAFDQACAASAAGDADQARALFQKAALSTDTELSIKAHYNLGCLEADQARTKLGDDPAAAEGDVREESISLLLAAVGRYRDVLRFDPHHKNARHNLELIRVFIKHIQSQWAERDKQKARDEKDLLQFLQMIEDQETEIRSLTRTLRNENDSPRTRHAVREAAESQRSLHEEIEPLKEKISQQIQASQQPAAGGNPTGNSPPADQMQDVEKLLLQLADEAGKRMLSAAEDLTAGNFDAAVSAETESLNQLNQLYMAVAPYQNILQRSVQTQESLAPDTADEEKPNDEPDTAAEEGSDDKPDAAADTKSTLDSQELQAVDFEQSTEFQSRITDWSHMLSLKAEAELPQVKQQLTALEQTAAPAEDPAVATDEAKTTTDPEEPEPKPQTPDEPPAKGATPASAEQLTEEEQAAKAQQQQRKQLQGLVESMERAIELGPDAEQHSLAAARFLKTENTEQAAPEQIETLKILKKIAEPLVSDPQDQNQQNDDKQQQNSDDQQEKKNDQQQDDQQQKQEQQKPKESEQQKSEREEQQNQESKKQQAESVLRQARDRERQRREMEKQLREILMRGIKVDKDW